MRPEPRLHRGARMRPEPGLIAAPASARSRASIAAPASARSRASIAAPASDRSRASIAAPASVRSHACQAAHASARPPKVSRPSHELHDATQLAKVTLVFCSKHAVLSVKCQYGSLLYFIEVTILDKEI
jgi:hypothetical protein